MSGPLETSEDNLGMAVDGCERSPDGKHLPDMSTLGGHVLVPNGERLYVIDAKCLYCNLVGSRCINPLSFNWD